MPKSQRRISTDYSRNSTNRYETRRGKSDLSGDEYFKDDGLPAGGYPRFRDGYIPSKRYHRDNAVLRVGGRSTGRETVTSLPGAQSFPVILEQGEYYFVRVIAGNFRESANDRGLIDKFRWSCTIRSDFDLNSDLFVTNPDINFGGLGGFSGLNFNFPGFDVQIFDGPMTFSGRSCINSDGFSSGGTSSLGDGSTGSRDTVLGSTTAGCGNPGVTCKDPIGDIKASGATTDDIVANGTEITAG